MLNEIDILFFLERVALRKASFIIFNKTISFPLPRNYNMKFSVVKYLRKLLTE